VTRHESCEGIAYVNGFKEDARGANGRVYLAGYRGDLLIDYCEISSSGGK
jgi:hypothetical protein